MSENEFSVNEFIVREMGYPGAIKQEVVGELVRCKDCKSWKLLAHNKSGIHICQRFISGMQGEDFCSRWERREDG